MLLLSAAQILTSAANHSALSLSAIQTRVLSVFHMAVSERTLHTIFPCSVEKVYMLTAIGGDSFSAGLRQNCERAGIDMSRALMAIDERSSVYLFIADEKGDMRLAVCDAQISEKIDDKYLSDKLDLLNEAAVVVIDCNLTETAIAFILQNCTAALRRSDMRRGASATGRRTSYRDGRTACFHQSWCKWHILRAKRRL